MAAIQRLSGFLNFSQYDCKNSPFLLHHQPRTYSLEILCHRFVSCKSNPIGGVLMNTKEHQELSILIEQATAGDRSALETVLTGVQDLVFNLSLRMLGTFHDAEDASQDILLKVMTHLSSFKGESAFTTWVCRIAINHLKDYKKHMFAQFPLSFELYGEDIRSGKIQDVPDLTQNVEKPFWPRN